MASGSVQQRDCIPTMLPLPIVSENRLAKHLQGRPCDHVYVYAYRSMATSIFSVAPTSKFSSSAVLKLSGMSSPKLRYQPESTMSLHTSAKRRLYNCQSLIMVDTTQRLCLFLSHYRLSWTTKQRPIPAFVCHLPPTSS
ncbi:hypothetical protein HO173_006231 [Letharia columbiana]|uniref:Uncharacterized protein n=1 Tax=Letharia columbiana TaxID=112416 RepID=A0A8H6L4Q1_9LECA|nr:uncharacterized protein HO173_006231 [Letharia columbiana]KAF6235548.1 hypothetical protein HO173_006231 [Letharia columbiana]